MKKYKIEFVFFIILISLQFLVIFFWQLNIHLSLFKLLNSAILLTGVIGLIFHKFVRRRPIIEMGFSFKNLLFSLKIAFLFLIIIYFVNLVIPFLLGLIKITVNPLWKFSTSLYNLSFLSVTKFLLFNFIILFVNCLLGEELAFRGFLMNSLLSKTSFLKAIILNSVFFCLWHVPYWIFFREVTLPWPLIIVLLIQALSNLFIATFFIITRSLYGVSLYHALIDLVQYSLLTSSEKTNLFTSQAIFLYQPISPSTSWLLPLFGVSALLLQLFLIIYVWKRRALIEG